MKSHNPEEVVLNRQQVQEHAVESPAQTANQGTCNRIQYEMICRGHNNYQDRERIEEAQHDTKNTAPRGQSEPNRTQPSPDDATMMRWERNCQNGKAD